MSPLEILDEKKAIKEEYEAVKKHLGEMILEHNAQEDKDNEDFVYFSRKFEDLRTKLRK